MYCTKCGKELFDEAVMCPQCGTPTINAETPVENIVSNEDSVATFTISVAVSGGVTIVETPVVGTTEATTAAQ